MRKAIEEMLAEAESDIKADAAKQVIDPKDYNYHSGKAAAFRQVLRLLDKEKADES